MATLPVALAVIDAALPMLKPLAESLIAHVEQLFGAKTGPTKFDVVLQQLAAAANALATAGKLPGLPNQDQLAAILESIFQNLKLSPGGIPVPTPSSTPLPAGSYTLSGTLTLKS